MALTKLALTLLGTIGLTAGTVLAVAEPTPDPLPDTAAATSSCSPCKKDATACAKSKCKTTPVAVTAAECSKDACSKEARATKTVSKAACAEDACTAKASADKPCDRASACDGAPVSMTACAEKSKCGKDACTTEKCTKAVSANAACGKSKCTETVSAKAECGASKCTEAVAATAKCEGSKCEGSKCSEVVATKAACGKSKCTDTVSATTKCAVAKCQAAKSGTSKCTEAVSTKACAKDACATKACSAECEGKCEGKCDACPCKAKSDCESKCDKDKNVVDADSCRSRMTVGAALNHSSGLIGKVVFTAKAETGTCETSNCHAENGECQGHTVYGIDFNGMKPSIKRRTVYVANCSRCRDAVCDEGDIVATACEAKPACVTATCPVSACVVDACAESDCSACDRDSCRGNCVCVESDLARNSEPASAACSSCDQCQCGTCACDGAALHAGVNHAGDRPGVAHVGHFRFEHLAPGAGAVFGWSSQFMNPAHGPAIAGWEPQREAYGHDMVQFAPEQELPGRVRLTSVLPPHYFHARHPHLPPGTHFDMPHPGMALSSFGMPVSTGMPASAAMPERRPERHARANSVEGTWSRTFGDETVVFTCEDGRLWGRLEGGSLEFSGTCSVSEDGQIFGLIDNIEAPGVPGKFTSWLVDQPFAVRFRLDGGDLIVKDFRCADLPTTIEHGDDKIPVGDAVRTFVCGRFARGESGTH